MATTLDMATTLGMAITPMVTITMVTTLMEAMEVDTEHMAMATAMGSQPAWAMGMGAVTMAITAEDTTDTTDR